MRDTTMRQDKWKQKARSILQSHQRGGGAKQHFQKVSARASFRDEEGEPIVELADRVQDRT